MGNALRILHGLSSEPSMADESVSGGSLGPHSSGRFAHGLSSKPSAADESVSGGSLGPHGVRVSASTVCVSALAHDLFLFEITSQVPDGLSNHLVSSKKAQADWYGKLLDAWKGAKPPPKTPEEAARLVIQTSKGLQIADVEGLLAFYGLPLPQTLVELSAEVPTSLPQGVQFELLTLPVEGKAIPDGDTISVYVSTADPRESSCVPIEVQVAAVERSMACADRNYEKADTLHKTVIDAGYRVIIFQNEEILARKYHIRLRGIDAPESSMPYGKEAKEELAKLIQGKCLRVLVYGEDHYGRSVGDVYCNGIFIQEAMLKKGCAWHYTAYDKRPELASWEKEARAKRVGLWASPNPEKPCEWRKDEGRQITFSPAQPSLIIPNWGHIEHVPDGLSNHVVSSKEAQADWYGKRLDEWKEAKPPPKTPEEAARLVIQTSKGLQIADVEGLLAFHGLPLPQTLVELSAEVPTSLPQGVQFEFLTLPVDGKAIPDGDNFSVYVSTADPRESSCVPSEVQVAAVERSMACADRNYEKANTLHKIIIDAGYRVIIFQNEEILARKYRIRLRGIDAPEGSMPYGKEAKEELAKLIQGKCLRVLVYGEDHYGRSVGDVYCNGIFIQEAMLKKGCAWHYTAYDKRPELASWEKEARAKRVGLWASPNPEKPWEWRKDKRRQKTFSPPQPSLIIPDWGHIERLFPLGPH